MSKCKASMQEGLLKNLAAASDWEKHVVYNQERKIAEKPLTRFRPQPNCDGVARLSQLPRAQDVDRYLSVQYKACGHEFCANCASRPHQNKACDQADDKAYIKWRKGKKVKPCPGCGHDVQKNAGCSSMDCPRCSSKWCWKCGLATPSYACPRCTKNYSALYNPPAPRRQTWGDFFFAAPADPFLYVLVVLVGCMAYLFFAK